MADVAERAGVSRALVSIVMREVPGVGVEYGFDWVAEHLVSESLTVVDVDKAFEESISESYPETVKIGWIDPLSGPLANIGQNSLKTFQFMAEKVNANNPAGVKFEIVSFDNKASPQESLNTLKAAIDQGIRYVTQGNGSAVAGALADFVACANRNPPTDEAVFIVDSD